MHLLAVLATDWQGRVYLLWATNPVGHALFVEVAAARVSIGPATQITDDAKTLCTLGEVVGEK